MLSYQRVMCSNQQNSISSLGNRHLLTEDGIQPTTKKVFTVHGRVESLSVVQEDLQIIYSQKLTWWGWGFRFCRQISGKHQNGFDKTKNIAFEHENFRPTKSKHPTPLLLGHKAPGASTKSK